MVNTKQEAITILNEALKELESPKGRVTSGVQKLWRAASILNEEKIISWCDFQLGKPEYVRPIKKYINVLSSVYNNNNQQEAEYIIKSAEQILEESGITIGVHVDRDDIDLMLEQPNTGCPSIECIEQENLNLGKKQPNFSSRDINDQLIIVYTSGLAKRIAHVKRKVYEKAVHLLRKYALTGVHKTAFDFLKEEVDDKLLELNPELAEKLMIVFKSVSSDNKEEWSHALTSCRRLIEGLADELFPPIDTDVNGRKLGQQQYINRLWAFMDKAIESDSNKAVAKAHVDFLGSYLQKIHNLTNKGVHDSVTKVEAVKTVFHTYLLIADLLGYLDKSFVNRKTKLNIHKATLDELESLLSIKRTTAKEIIKLRVEHGVLTPELLGTIQGIGSKTVAKAQEVFSFDSIE